MDQDDTHLTGASIAAAALLTLLCAITFTTGVSQQWFETFRPPEEYAAALVRGATVLRVIVAIDDVFVAAYVSSFVLFALRLGRGGLGPLHRLVLVAGVVAGVLDLEENHHILGMLAMAEHGLPIPVGEILRRSVASPMKWLLGQVAFVLLAFVLTERDALTRVFRATLLWVQLPIGALVWVTQSTAYGPTLLWARYASILSGFVVIAALVYRRPAARAVVAAAGSGAPA